MEVEEGVMCSTALRNLQKRVECRALIKLHSVRLTQSLGNDDSESRHKGEPVGPS